jgi:hypothetical protein
MKHKKLKLCSLLLFAFLFTDLHAQSIYVVNKSGIQNGYALASLKTITFSGSVLNINKKDGSALSSALSDIRFLTFSPLTEVVIPTFTKSSISIYPNPVQNSLTLSFLKESIQQSAEISISSIDGKIIYSNHLQQPSNTDFQINTSAWSRGMYILRINSGNEVISRKIIKN